MTTTAPTAPRLSGPKHHPRRGPRLRWTVLLLTSLGIAVYFPFQYAGASLETLSARGTGLASTFAQRPLFVQVAFYFHIIFAGLALLIGPFQFSTWLRRRAVNVHRWIGRTYVAAVLVGSVAAFIMSCYSSVALLGFFGFGSLAVLWGWTTYRGYRSVRTGDIASHQAWMIRSFALTYAAPTLRMWLGVLLGLQLLVNPGADVGQAFTNAYAVVPFMCWLPNIVVAELMIRRRNLPGLRLMPSPVARAQQPTASMGII